MTYGVLLPHFGPHSTRARILGAGKLAERLGFDAVWVRDHLLWKPHTHEAADAMPTTARRHDEAELTFLEPIVTLATLGANTERITLGTSVLIPLRSPAKTAQELAALSYLTGGRVVAGIGAGHDRAEIAAAGMDPDRRRETVIDMAAILRRLWSEDEVTYRGEIFSLDSATLRPHPPIPIPILFGGPSRLAVRLAVQHYDGWIAGTVPFSTLDGRLERFHELAASAGKTPALVSVPRTSIDRDRSVARRRAKVDAMADDGVHHWEPGSYSTIEDLRGALLTGEPAEIVEQVLEFADRGFDHFVFDLRWQFERFEEGLELIAERVVPELQRAARPKVAGGREA